MAIPFDQRYTVRPSYFFKGVFKHCHSLSGAIYARLFSLQCTREGCSGTCYTTIPHLEDEFGEKEYAITQALKRLKDCGLISTQIEKWSQGKRTRVFFNLHHEYLYEDNDKGNLKIKVSPSPENQGMGYPENQTTPIGGSPENQGMGYPENQGQDTDILSTELSTDFLSTERATAQPQKAKPSKNKPIYPQSKEQCYTLFNEHRGMSETNIGVCTKRTDPTYVQNEHRGMSETNIGVCTKRTDGYVQNAQQGTEINTDINTGVNTEVAPSQNFDPQLEANIAFYEFMQETNTQGDCAPQIDNHTQTRNFATSVQNNAPVEPAKPKRERKPRVQQPIPQSADEVMPYIEKFLKRHEKEGAYSNINKAHYAGRILDYYLKDDGTWRDNKNNIIHEPYRKVSAWLSKEYENGKLVIDTSSKPIDIFSDEFDEEVRKLERELSGEDENTPIEASYEFVDDEETQLLEDKKDE